MGEGDDLKLRTARTLKWNVIDRVSQQVLYAVTGIILARELSQADFGLVGAVLIFQAFANLLVDSGFSYALLQRKQPTQTDYSSVLWFNLFIATILYIALWACAPLIADCFEHDARLVPLSRVMFVSIIINAGGIVQTNRFMKAMHVRPVALSNAAGLSAGAVAGIWLAISGFGAWAIVWQTIVTAVVKTVWLWVAGHWRPSAVCSWTALRSFIPVGSGMMATSFLNTLFLNIYSFVIGNRVGLVSLGYYTQSDKWSKMGIASLSQVLTSSFLPVLSGVQDDSPRFNNMTRKMGRMTAYLLFPCIIGLCCVATPLFHVLFGTKWDASILLFQLLLIRGVFTVFTGLYSNYLLALAKSRLIVWAEVLRDGTAIVALAVTWPYMALTTPTDPVAGLTIMLWGQIAAAAVAWYATLWFVSHTVKVSGLLYVADDLPYLGLGLLTGAAALSVQMLPIGAFGQLILGCAAGAIVYLGINQLLHSKIQADALAYLRGKL